MSDYKYKAFISYRHLEPDMQAAEKLQKLLEAYKPPKNLAGDSHEKWRIFRDVSELQSSSDLSEDIRNAIESSEFLIVICSPEYNESKWCAQELTHFRELHGNTNENVITLLVHGDPQKAFPEALTYKEVTTTNEKGEEVTVKVEVEPLAANITAGTLKESMKKLDTEYLRIAAPLLGCDFNDLYQREKRREAARRRKVFGTVFGILSLITIISVYSSVTISRKNVQIQQQNEQIQQQNKDLLVENAGHLAAESEKLFKDRSLIPAVRKAVEALPTKGSDKPVVTEAEYALSRELGMYSARNTAPRIALKHDCAVEKISFMGGGKSIVSQDATGVYFWDVQSGSLIKKITGDGDFASSKGSDELKVFYDIPDDKTGTYFDTTAAPGNLAYSPSSVFGTVYSAFAHAVDEEEPGTGGDLFISNKDGTVWKLSGVDGEVIWKSDIPENCGLCNDVLDGGEYILRVYNDKKEMPGGATIPGSEIFVQYIDKATGEQKANSCATEFFVGSLTFGMNQEFKGIINDIAYFYNSDTNILSGYDASGEKLKEQYFTKLPGSDGGNIRTVNISFAGDDPVVLTSDVFALDTATTIQRYEKGLSKAVWTTSLPVNFKDTGKTFLFKKSEIDSDCDVMAIVTNNTISFLNYDTGSLINNINLDCDIACVSFTSSGLIMLMNSKGEEYVVSAKNYVGSNASPAAYLVETLTTSVSLCSYSLGKYVTCDDYSNTAYIQFPEANPGFTAIDAGEHIYKYNVLGVSSDGKTACLSAQEFPNDSYSNSGDAIPHFYIYSPDSGECRLVEELEDYTVAKAAFCSNNKLAVQAVQAGSSGMDRTQNKLLLVDVDSLSVQLIENAPPFDITSAAIFHGDSGVFYMYDYCVDAAFLSGDGSVYVWSGLTSSSREKTIYNRLCSFHGSRAAIACEYKDSEKTGTTIEIWDPASGTSIAAGFFAETDYAAEILHVFWLSDDTVGVFLSDRSVVLVNASDGAVKSVISLDGTSQEPVSVMPLTDDTFAVLCRDNRLYEMNLEGFTGRSLALEFSEDSNGSISGNNNSAASMLTSLPAADGNVFAVWDGKDAWLINLADFSVRYNISKFAAAPSGSPIIYTSDFVTGISGYYPIYSTSQLTDAAEKFLAPLSENGKDGK